MSESGKGGEMETRLLSVTRNKSVDVLTAALLAAMVISLILTLLAEAQPLEAGVEKLKVPAEAPDFTLRELQGGKITLKELGGKIVVLNFFSVD
jgi:cytochrome oxidase Cu insertion factor (SCO1/SenC/PrrC family)